MSGAPSNLQLAAACGEILFITVIGYYAFKFLVGKLDPTSKQKAEAKKTAESLMRCIGVEECDLSDYELVIAANLVDPLSVAITWSSIGGLDDIIRDMKENVVLPFRNRELFRTSTLLSPPKGILLYGPPGCGKTMLAKATAKEAGCRFLNLDVSSLTDKWYGESQKLAGAVFSLAKKIQPCIIFIDEIDSFLRARSSTDHEATAMIKAQFMSLWDGLLTERKTDVIIMGATNRPQDIDKAILRRMPCRFYVPMPDKLHRMEILMLILRDEMSFQIEDIDFDELADLTAGCSGSDLKELCRLAALSCVRDASARMNTASVESESEQAIPNIGPMSMKDFEEGMKRMRNSHYLMASYGMTEQ